MDYDFCGYATKNDLQCADGRVIRHDAFKENDGQTVPLVWQHVHSDPTNVLGHALLENRDDGVYAYAAFNNTPSGRHAKEMVRHGDISAMSIYANRLKQFGSDVVHGVIREVSLVLAGANPGAYIENISFAHADGSYTEVEDEAVIYCGPDTIEFISHADENEEDDMGDDILDQLTDEQIDAVNRIIDAAIDDAVDDLDDEDVLDDLTDEQLEAIGDYIEDAVNNALEHADDDDDDDYDDDDYDDYDEDDDEDFDDYDDEDDIQHSDYYDDYYDDYDAYDDYNLQHADDDSTVGEIWDTLDEDQKKLVYFLIGQAKNDDTAEHSDVYDGGSDMKHNIFDEDAYYEDDDVLTHDEFEAIMEDAYNANSLRDVFLAHGITNLDVLFPEAKLVTPTPEMISRDMGWVDQLWNAIKRTPFARIKSTAANITGDEARARGYVKGNLKAEEVIVLLSRETTPQTVYKKQKLDRDDVIDITDIDVIAWMKQEMRVMLNEEICRAILVSDGRGSTHADKIKEDKIRPVYQDNDVYTIHYELTYGQNDTEDQKASKLADAAVRSRKDYKGSGTPWFFASNETISDLMLAKDTIGRRLYKDENELKAALRVSKIVECPILENVTRNRAADATAGITAATMDLKALIFNPVDYTVGADKGGAVSLFDDFDIDYNQMKYLIETRISGALTKPYSAIALEVEHPASTSGNEG